MMPDSMRQNSRASMSIIFVFISFITNCKTGTIYQHQQSNTKH